VHERSTKRVPQLAARIEAEIVAAGWPVGARFGNEETLLERYGVGRAMFREAIRIVEQHQVARMRRGPKGGLIVTAPQPSAAAAAMTAYLRYAGATPHHLLAARAAIDASAAEYAAERMTAEGAAMLRTIAEAPIAPEVARHGLGDPLFVAIAERSGDRTLFLASQVIECLLARYATPAWHGPVREALHATQAERAAVVTAVISGNGLLAGELAPQYVAALAAGLHAPDGEEATFPAARTDPGSPSYVDVAAGAPRGTFPKMAALLADRIENEVVERGWPVGERLGNEPDLVARHGTSRAVFREATRMLEHRGIAHMKLGHYGGLVVMRPDPTAASDALGLLLRFREAQRREILGLRVGIEQRILGLVIDRGVSAEELLGLGVAITEAAAASVTCDALHVELATLAANPVLQVLLAAILSIEHSMDRAVTPGASITAAHEALLDAIATGSHVFARTRVSRHLAAMAVANHA
jgi:DNA-binding FadR family transcriptional regulator